MVKLKNNNSFATIIVISCCLLFFNFSFFPKNILSWDVFGYYMYLPMIFIYNNWGLQDINILHTIIEHYQSSSTLYQAYQTETGYWVMRYPIGMSMLYAPFFFIGHLVCAFTSFPKDGFSLPYQVAILSGGIFYSITGFYFSRKIMLRFFSDSVTALSLLIIFFGTNYFIHCGFHGSNAMSHNYLFALYAFIVWFTIRWHETFRLKYAVLLGFACGLTIMARPSEIVCLLIPFLWQVGNSYSILEKLKLFLRMKNHLLVVAGILLVIALPQLIYWKIISGKFLFNSYGNNEGEGFEFFHPYVTEVLVSFRKGWFIYTPVILFAISGIVLSIKQRKDYSYPIFIYFILNLYIVSSWSCWWYAESFSQRSLVQSYAVMLLPLGAMVSYLINNVSKWIQHSLFIVIVLLIVLNLFQTWQFLHGIIHPSRMTKEAYFASFGKTKIPDEMEKLLLLDRSSTWPVSIDELKYSKTKEFIEGFENNPHAGKEFVFSGAYSMKMDSTVIYSTTIERTFEELTSKDHAKLKLSIQVYCTTDVKNNPGSLIVSFEHNGYSYGYMSTDLEKLNIELNKWTEVSMYYLTPVIRTKKDALKVYYWHRGKMPVYLDDLKAEVWEKK